MRKLWIGPANIGTESEVKEEHNPDFWSRSTFGHKKESERLMRRTGLVCAPTDPRVDVPSKGFGGKRRF